MSSSNPPHACADVNIAPMADGDLDQVVAIERDSSPAPWPARLFLEDLERDWAHIDIARAARPSEHVLGFANYWVVQDELHLLNLATHPDHRRCGVGSRLMQHLIDVADNNVCHLIILEVRRSNEAALALYRAHRFEEVGVRSRYYADGEDALVMALDLSAHAIRKETE